MDPVTSIAASSKTSSFWVTKELTSVLAPGVVLLCELTLLIQPHLRKGMKSPLGNEEPSVFVVLVVVVALAWLVGYISREIGFKILFFTEPGDSSGRTIGNSSLPPVHPIRTIKNWMLGLRCPHQTPAETRSRLVLYAGEREVEYFLRSQPILLHLMAANREFDGRTGGGNIPDDAAAAFFSYCKLWLRSYAPELGLDSIELEINIVVSALVPTALLPLLAAQSFHSHQIWWTAATAIGALVALVQMARSFRRLRGAERWEAARNTLIATILKRVENSRPGDPKTLPLKNQDAGLPPIAPA